MTLFSAISPLPFFPYSCSIYTCVSFSFRKKFNISRPLSLLLLPNSRVWLTHKNIPRILMHNMTRMIFIFPNCLPILPTLANSTILPLTKSKYWGENVLTPLLSPSQASHQTPAIFRNPSSPWTSQFSPLSRDDLEPPKK